MLNWGFFNTLQDETTGVGVGVGVGVDVDDRRLDDGRLDDTVEEADKTNDTGESTKLIEELLMLAEPSHALPTEMTEISSTPTTAPPGEASVDMDIRIVCVSPVITIGGSLICVQSTVPLTLR